jgi:ribosome-associated protein
VVTIQEVRISGETIRLGQLLKLSGIAESGGDSKALLFAEVVRVNGVPETRRGRQLHDGDLVEARGEAARVAAR